ncbi:MAG: hypothetical protein K2Q10_03505 [Rhodospirillales bacterium]|nr:hypothetical protein [Rhodospirillales bacterium]
MRRAFADTLYRIGRENDRLVFLTGDLGFQVFDDFEREFPERYLNVGVAEAQLVDCAAGLALEGFRPVTYSIASFMTGRAFEQIRVAIGYHRLPVVVVGAGGGYTYASSGVTHHAKEDAALMALIPGMTVTLPGDPAEVETLLPQLVALPGPSYMRVGRFGEPRLDSATSIELGKGRLLSDGAGIGILSTGGTAVPALAAVRRLQAEGKHPALLHFHTLRPFDETALAALAGRVSHLVAVEDHGRQGGLAATVADWLARTGSGLPLTYLGPGDELVLGNPHHDQLAQSRGYDAEGIATCCRSLWPAH